ncbi:CBD9-like protein [Panus rudis PR-1116 ss-1]|nr:CBD9-like protein [Panus rudis PR-1116 ss-1]
MDQYPRDARSVLHILPRFLLVVVVHVPAQSWLQMQMTPSLTRLLRLLKYSPLTLYILVCGPLYSEAAAQALTGDSWCGTLMCVDATVNGSTVTYQLKALNQLGWMAIGFGGHMNDSKHVILWKNADNTVTLSQRIATGHVEPQPDLNPPRRAVVSQTLTNLTSEVSPVLAFEIPKNSDTVQQLVWAFGVTRPTSDATAEIEQHLDAGPFTLDLTRPKTASMPTASSTRSDEQTASVASPKPTGAPAASSPVTPPTTTIVPHHDAQQDNERDMMLTAHAILCAIGFLILIPVSVLVARWSRTNTPNWLAIHWLMNCVLALPIVIVGWLLGPLSVSRRKRAHVANEHQIFGVALFALYILQMTSGMLIHMRRPKHARSNVHPVRNVMHVILGLLIIAGSFFQVFSYAIATLYSRCHLCEKSYRSLFLSYR